MVLGPEDCGRLETLIRREWLETDGLGNYAAGTLSGINTRRHHGLLVAEAAPHAGRRVLVAKADETVFVGGQRHELAANQYPDTIHPQGYRNLVEFRLDPWPIWTWQFDGLRLEKHVFALHGAAASALVWRVLEAAGPIALEVRPLIAGRDMHATALENWSFRRQADLHEHVLEMEPYDEGSHVVLAHPRGVFQGEGFWFYNFLYPAETDQGMEDREDLFNPGVIVYPLHTGEQAVLLASTTRLPSLDIDGVMDDERRRRAALVANESSPLRQRLLLAADQFVVRQQDRPAVIAGYPWFEQRRRDTLLATPGLALCAGRGPVARALLEAAALHLRLSGEQPRESGADADLWLAWAGRHYLAATGDQAFGASVLRPALKLLVDRCRSGEVEGLRIDDDLLFTQGLADVPLTWMDARLGHWLATPRQGKAVEINALWYTTLRLLTELGEDEAAPAERMRERFVERFWSADRGWLLDVADGPAGDDAALRPNQLLAVSLHPDLLPDAVAEQVLTVVETHLLTPFGLRTLAPTDPQYRGRYQGDLRTRDEAYHQGSVWPWLLGPYADAVRRLRPATAEAVVARLMEPWAAHLGQYGVGQVAQLFDGEPAHEPRGCFAHAAAVAELLRLSQPPPAS